MQQVNDNKATALTRARYQCLSGFYDLMEGLSEQRYSPWRKQLWELVMVLFLFMNCTPHP